eukprot:TRINITY_DN5629_c0_g1_i1.p1 TRINITY_DN5629_c0_g1~~TRINITY_DN5629_c0_g1_i1.p1  ORF type:complete len:1050 (-),score=233.24 TRINITY_DN5629_c0_g1_i1:3344-6466(-)
MDEEHPLIQSELLDEEEEEQQQAPGQNKTWRRWFRWIPFLRGPVRKPRTVPLSGQGMDGFPENKVHNQKYNVITFLPIVLYEQFKFFANMYFLVVALTQFVDALKVGYLITYFGPLAFVLAVTIGKEAWDDVHRWMRDREANKEKFRRLTRNGFEDISSADIRVGHIIQIQTNQRAPADFVLLRTTEKSGASFIRTDQLDGETDWKLRRAVDFTQKLPRDEGMLELQASVYADRPKKDIYQFIGNFTATNSDGTQIVEPLNLENTVWQNTVIASGVVCGLVVYTGKETRSVMNTSTPETKVGILDLEINNLSKVLAALLILLSFVLIALKGFNGYWWIYFFRYILLLSAIIPISMRVNLDLGKGLYCFLMMRDPKIPGTAVRTSTIPEELGRIQYLLTDKTGTLTQNDMVFKKLHLGTVAFSKEALDDLAVHLRSSYETTDGKRANGKAPASPAILRRTMPTKIKEAILSLALCHNVTPVIENDAIAYQASSPDEIALVKFTESIHLTLAERSLYHITLKNPLGDHDTYEVLNIFPFTSETKRMGIIVKDKTTGVITFYEKGADVVMTKIVQENDWLEEECGNMAREGLRTLVFGKKDLSEADYERFKSKYAEARTAITDRDGKVQSVVESLENGLELIGLTGVEDKLQEDVRPTLEMLRNAGIKVWMLTGDKIETATCIAVSAKLVSKTQSIFQFVVRSVEEARQKLTAFSHQKDCVLVIDGSSLQLCLDNFKDDFIQVAKHAPAVVCCRCSPTQKADIVKLIKSHTKKRTAAIGDGGNDVSMIQAADVGIGIEGKEGKQASLAADFSITQFSHLARLVLWHGRNSYKRSARLSQFVIHRGLLISFIQALFSAIYYFVAISVYNGILLVGYATIYTMAPVFSLVLDCDVSEEIAFRYPELYQELQKGRSLSYKTFFIWVWKSVYQAGVIMVLSIFLFENAMINIVAITFTSLILAELLNIAFEIQTWHPLMIASEVLTVLVYFASMIILKTSFDFSFITTWEFLWKVSTVTALSCLPIYLGKWIKKKYDPPAWMKLGAV